MTLLDKLKEYSGEMLPMHMPGHKRNAALAPYLSELGAEIDITETEGFDNLHSPKGILREEMERTAALWGSGRSFWLVNGSTSGILAGIKAAVPAGGTVICARNCHRSVYNGLRLIGARTVFLMPEARGEALGPLSADCVAQALKKHPGTALVIVTSPTYEGVLSDIPAICRAAHTKGVPVLVDEAHGAHLGFGHGFPDGAVKAGADIVVHSLHKTLPSLTQTAVLHLNGRLVNPQRVSEALSVFQTSSPSYLLMASISGCVDLLKSRGEEMFARWSESLSRFYKKAENLKNLSVIHGEGRDPSKIVISTERAGISGADLAKILREYRIEPEMAAGSYVVAMTGMGDTPKSLDRLYAALEKANAGMKLHEPCGFLPPVLPEAVISPGEAEKCPKITVELSKAEGRISGESVWAYPPGIPLVIPGERITAQLINLMNEYTARGIPLESTTGGMPCNICVTGQ